MTRISRRAFLIAGTLASLHARAAVRAGTRGLDADVIVVGAGISGLNTAWLLEQQGLKVLVLEGRQRVGGRVHTLLDEPGYPEMGFNSMGAGYGRGIDAARRAGVELVDLTPRARYSAQTEFVLGGEFIRRDAWPTHPRNPFPEPFRAVLPSMLVAKLVSEKNPLAQWSTWIEPQSAPLDVSMYEFLKAQGLSDPAIALAFDTAPYHGETAKDVSALMYEFSDGWTKAQIAVGSQQFGVKGGNAHLPAGMAKLLRGDLLLGRRVTGVAADATEARVRCADGATFRAKRVVLALPFSVVRTLKIEPRLTGTQADAVATLGYQAISIMFLRVNKPFWEDDRLGPSMWTDGPAGWIVAQHFGTTPDEITGFMVQARGRLAHRWDAMGADAAKRMVVAEIERLRPAAKGQLTATHLQSWTTDPFNRGDWSVWRPGQIAAYASVMSRPAGRIHFAGEHTAVSNRGLEAAFESSERVVTEVLDDV